MVSLGIPALIAAGASFPTGFGFGAGYGTGVRAGYDIIYPHLTPYLKNIADGMINLLPKPGQDDRAYDEPAFGTPAPPPTNQPGRRGSHTPDYEGRVLGEPALQPTNPPTDRGRGNQFGQPAQDPIAAAESKSEERIRQQDAKVQAYGKAYKKANANTWIIPGYGSATGVNNRFQNMKKEETKKLYEMRKKHHQLYGEWV